MRLLVLAILSFSVLTQANCTWNTDDQGALEANSTWNYLSNHPDCDIKNMILSDFWGNKKNVEIILFNYQKDPGHHNLLQSTIGVCTKNKATQFVSCKQNI